MKRLILMAGVCAGLAFAASAAQAQSVDYGSLEQVFNEPVTTSATGSPQRSTEAPVDMTIISAEDIHRSGAKDLPTILSRVAGVDVLNFAAGQSDVGVRGYDQARSSRLLVLINGRQVYLDHFGYTDWNALPVELSEIRQIEVVRGPNSAIFGFNAVSGVINIITYDPKFDNFGDVQAYGGNNGAEGVSAVKTRHWSDKLFVRFSAGADKQEEWKMTAGSTVDPTQIENPWVARANVDAIAQLMPKLALRVEGGWSNLAATQVISTYAYTRQSETTWDGKATLTADTDFGQMQAQAYQNHLDAIVPGRQYLNTITVGSLQDIFKIGANNTFRIGLEHRDNTMDTASFPGGVVSYTVWAPSAMWNWNINTQLAFTAAFRYDDLRLKREGAFPVGAPQASNSLWDRTMEELSSNIGLVYKATPADTLRATYARGVQAPTLLQLGGLVIPSAGTTPPFGYLITGNPDLVPAIVTNYELAYDHDFAALKSKASLKLFSQQTDSMTGQYTFNYPSIPATLHTYPAYEYNNVGDSSMWGVEAAASGKFGAGFKWSADTTYTKVSVKPSTSLSDVILRKVDYAASTPEFRSNLALGWTGGPWTVDVFAHNVTSYQSYNGNVLETVGAYTTLGGRVAYKAPLGIELALSGQNLTSNHQAQGNGLVGLQAETQVLFSAHRAW